MFKNTKVRNAVMLGSLCSVSYLAVYIARNVLGAVKTDMVTGGFTNDFIGSLEQVYFYSYAIGQLINGILGEKIKARNMISFGLILAGVCSFVFPRLPIEGQLPLQIVYGMTGFFLAMIYGPMTKVVAENTEPHHATRCSLGYTFASFLGSPMAGILASVLVWQDTFTLSSIMLWIMGGVCFMTFMIFEKKGIVKYGQFKRKKEEKRSGYIKELLRRNIVAFILVAFITGIIRTALISWLTTYFKDGLGLDETAAKLTFSTCTLVICTSTFISVFVYERLKRNMETNLLIMFTASALFFLTTFFVTDTYINIGLITVSILFNNCAATMLWSVYCPGLKSTGVVSGATGFLDFTSYVGAGTASKIIPIVVGAVGWKNMNLVWMGLMLIGSATAMILIFKKKFRKAELV